MEKHDERQNILLNSNIKLGGMPFKIATTPSSPLLRKGVKSGRNKLGVLQQSPKGYDNLMKMSEY